MTGGLAAICSPIYGTTKPDSVGVAHLAGLVVDADNLSPIPFANLYDSDNNLVGQTDDNGYYNVRVKSVTAEHIRFHLKVAKKGFQSFIQKENWADLPTIGAIFHFGLHGYETDKTAKPFSMLITETGSDLSYPNVLLTFTEVKAQQAFKRKLELAKTGNEHVFVEIDGERYIVNDTGWIQIGAADDLVIVDEGLILPASELNSLVKRKDIKSMTPVDGSGGAKFAVYTK